MSARIADIPEMMWSPTSALFVPAALPTDASRQPRRELLPPPPATRQVALAVFQLRSPGWWRRRRLARLLARQSRPADKIAWIGAGRLCVAMDGADAAGARRFAQRIARRASDCSLALRFHIAGGRGGAIAPPAALARRRDDDTQMLPIAMHRLPLWKRGIDIAGAVLGLAIFSWVMLIAAILIKLSGPGPVLFRQRRAGWGGRPFTIYKFRTMVADAEMKKASLRAQSEQDGPAFKMAHDPRVTTIGRILRTTSLDELPQFWNVLLGNMSLVGPRPLPLDEAAECLPWQQRRLSVTPGLTCIWQVRGRSRVAFDDWMRMDLEYIRRRGLVYDLYLLVLTVPAVILRRGAH